MRFANLHIDILDGCSYYVLMQGAIPTRDVKTLRMSRMAVLERLIAFGMQVVRGLKTSGKSLVACALDFARISRWIRVAIFLCSRIDDGALDAPRPPKQARAPAGEGPVRFDEDLFDVEDLHDAEEPYDEDGFDHP